MALAAARSDWAVGFEDETWWSRVARPALHAWSAAAPRLAEVVVARDDPEPKAVACYGLVLPVGDGSEEQLWLRFVDGRPVSAVTTQFLAWCGEPLMRKTYPVVLAEAERRELERLIAAGTAPARTLTHARILLKADQSADGPAWVDTRIAEAVEVSQPTVARVRQQYVTNGLVAALNRRPPSRVYQQKLDGCRKPR